MTTDEITTLLQTRDNICIVASILDIPADTAAIDALLSTVPAGRDNRIDLALGRLEAKLPERVDYGLNDPEIKADWLAIRGDTDL